MKKECAAGKNPGKIVLAGITPVTIFRVLEFFFVLHNVDPIRYTNHGKGVLRIHRIMVQRRRGGSHATR